MKLTTTQKDVLVKMRNGWELGSSPSGKRLQKEGLGRGGETKKVNSITFSFLYQKKMIMQDYWSFPTQRYLITELGIIHTLDLPESLLKIFKETIKGLKERGYWESSEADAELIKKHHPVFISSLILFGMKSTETTLGNTIKVAIL